MQMSSLLLCEILLDFIFAQRNPEDDGSDWNSETETVKVWVFSFFFFSGFFSNFDSAHNILGHFTDIRDCDQMIKYELWYW